MAPGAVGHSHNGLPAVFEALAPWLQADILDEVAVWVIVHWGGVSMDKRECSNFSQTKYSKANSWENRATFLLYMLFGLSHQSQHTSFPLVVMDQVLCLPRRTAGVAVGKIQQVKLEPAKHETDPQWIHGTFGPVQSHRRFKQDVLVFYAYKQITLKKMYVQCWSALLLYLKEGCCLVTSITSILCLKSIAVQ